MYVVVFSCMQVHLLIKTETNISECSVVPTAASKWSAAATIARNACMVYGGLHQ